jgi:hypothetical protein
MDPFVDWLLKSAVGPALFSWPAEALEQAAVGAAQAWWQRWRRGDDLGSRSAAALAAVVGLPLARTDVERLEGLLTSPALWETAAQSNGTVEDSLIAPIRDCLDPGRTQPFAIGAARAIAASVLAEGLRRSHPDRFDRVIAGVLQTEASVLASITAAVVTLDGQLSAQTRVDATRYRALVSHLDRVLARLPPGPAGRIELRSYLETMVRVLDQAPWMAELFDRWEGVSATAQALSVRWSRNAEECLGDPIVAARSSERLVITGSPGGGKSWLARRIAMDAAREGLAQLDRGESPSTIPIPLFVELSRLQPEAASARSARGELIAASLRLVTDLLPGGERTAEALRQRLVDPGTKVVLVLDGLDELAHDVRMDLLLLCESGVNVVLTTRDAAWSGQVPLDRNNDRHILARLDSLDRHDGVPRLAHQLLGPESAQRLLTLLDDSEQLSCLARKPLLCVWLCAITASLDEGDELPTNEIELCRSLILAVASGRWRRHGRPTTNADAAEVRRALRELAWAAAADDPRTGLAEWASEVPSARVGDVSEIQRDLLSAVAPVSRAIRPWEQEMRTFIHERLREHLVAEHLASMPVEQAYRHLEGHIWYDPKWQYILPATIYLHPQQHLLLTMIIDRGGMGPDGDDASPEGDGVLEVRAMLRRLLDLGNGTVPVDPALRAVVERKALSISSQQIMGWSRSTWEEYTWDADVLQRGLDAAFEHRWVPEARPTRQFQQHESAHAPEPLEEIQRQLEMYDCAYEAPDIAFNQIVAYAGANAPELEVLWERAFELINHHRDQGDSYLNHSGDVPELLGLLRSTGCPIDMFRKALVAFGQVAMTTRYFASDNESQTTDDWSESHDLVHRVVDACHSDDERALLASVLVDRLCSGSYYDWLSHAMGMALVRLGPTPEQAARSVSHLVAQLSTNDTWWEYCYVPTAEVACALFAAHPHPETLIPTIEASAVDLRVEFLRRLAAVVRQRSTLDEWTRVLPAFARCLSGPDWDGEVATVHQAQIDRLRSSRPT